MMGMISTKLISIQELHFQLHKLHRLLDSWATDFVTQLLQITHAQWNYQCLLVHNCTSGMLINIHKTELLEEIANHHSLGAKNLMEYDKYLLGCNLMDLATTNGEQKEYWLLAIKAAREASLLYHQTT
jgi:hypothetical protein